VPSRRVKLELTSVASASSPDVAPPKLAPKFSFVSLGCRKALVDSEQIIGRLRTECYQNGRDERRASTRSCRLSICVGFRRAVSRRGLPPFLET